MNQQHQSPYQQTKPPQTSNQSPYFNPYTSENTGKKTNNLSIIGFILSFATGAIGIIISVFALFQIKKTGERGRGLAIAGIIIGTLSSILIVLLFTIVIVPIVLTAISTAEAKSSATPTAAASHSTFTALPPSPSASVSPSHSPSATPSPTGNMGDAFPSAGDVRSPDTPYCKALDDFMSKVDAPDDAKPTRDEFVASLEALRDATEDDYIKHNLTRAVNAANSGDEEGFSEAIKSSAVILTFDSEKCSRKH